MDVLTFSFSTVYLGFILIAWGKFSLIYNLYLSLGHIWHFAYVFKTQFPGLHIIESESLGMKPVNLEFY